MAGFPNEITLSGSSVHTQRPPPHSERTHPSITLAWNSSQNEVLIVSQELPQKRRHRKVLQEINRLCLDAEYAMSLMEFSHRIESTLPHLDPLKPFRMRALEGEWRGEWKDGIHPSGDEPFSESLRDLFPKLFRAAVYGNAHHDHAYVWGTPNFDPEQFGSPYLMPLSRDGQPSWRIGYVGEKGYEHIFNTPAHRHADWKETETLRQLVETVLGHDSAYIETFAILENEKEFNDAFTRHEVRQKALALAESYTLQSDRVSPKPIINAISDCLERMIETWRTHPECEDFKRWTGPVRVMGVEMPISIGTGYSSQSLHPAIRMVVNGGAPSPLAATNPGLYRQVLNSLLADVQRTLYEGDLGVIVGFIDQLGVEHYFVVKNAELFQKNAVALGVPEGIEVQLISGKTGLLPVD